MAPGLFGPHTRLAVQTSAGCAFWPLPSGLSFANSFILLNGLLCSLSPPRAAQPAPEHCPHCCAVLRQCPSISSLRVQSFLQEAFRQASALCGGHAHASLCPGPRPPCTSGCLCGQLLLSGPQACLFSSAPESSTGPANMAVQSLFVVVDKDSEIIVFFMRKSQQGWGPAFREQPDL